MDTSKDRDFVSKLCNLEIPSDIKISPRDDKILYSTALTWGHMKGDTPVSTIWLATFGEENSSKQITDGTHKDHSPTWHPTRDEFAFISDRAGSGTKSAIYTMSTDGTADPVAITPIEHDQAIEKFKFSPNGSLIAFISKDKKTDEEKQREERKEDVQVWGQGDRFSRLHVVDVKTKQTRTLQLDQHVRDLCWIPSKSARPEDLRIVVNSCASTFIEEPHLHGTEIHIVNADLKQPRKLCTLSDTADELTWGSINLGKSEELYFSSNKTMDKNFSDTALYKLDISKEACEHERIELDNDVGVTAVKAVDGHIVVKAQNRLRDCLVCVATGPLYSCEQEIEAFDVAPGFMDGSSRLVIATSGVNHPVDVYSMEGKGGNKAQLSQHGKPLSGRKFGTYRSLTCSTADDSSVDIDGVYLEPATGGSEPFPTVVLVHGGPTTRIANAFNTLYYMLTPYLLSLGYAILLPNYRGSSGYGEKFASFAYGGFGKVEDADVVALTQHAIEKGYADPERLVVGGYSHGGLTTNLCALRNGFHGHGWKFKAAISGASISDWDSMAITGEMGDAYTNELAGGAAPWTSTQDNTSARGASALWAFREAMQRSKRDGIAVLPPILLIHGANDDRVPVSQAWGMRRALEYHSLPFEMVIYPRQGHMFHEQYFWIDMALRIGQWVERYIGPVRQN